LRLRVRQIEKLDDLFGTKIVHAGEFLLQNFDRRFMLFLAAMFPGRGQSLLTHGNLQHSRAC
jgi:hypothetical protein